MLHDGPIQFTGDRPHIRVQWPNHCPLCNAGGPAVRGLFVFKCTGTWVWDRFGSVFRHGVEILKPLRLLTHTEVT